MDHYDNIPELRKLGWIRIAVTNNQQPDGCLTENLSINYIKAETRFVFFFFLLGCHTTEADSPTLVRGALMEEG